MDNYDKLKIAFIIILLFITILIIVCICYTFMPLNVMCIEIKPEHFKTISTEHFNGSYLGNDIIARKTIINNNSIKKLDNVKGIWEDFLGKEDNPINKYEDARIFKTSNKMFPLIISYVITQNFKISSVKLYANLIDGSMNIGKRIQLKDENSEIHKNWILINGENIADTHWSKHYSPIHEVVRVNMLTGEITDGWKTKGIKNLRGGTPLFEYKNELYGIGHSSHEEFIRKISNKFYKLEKNIPYNITGASESFHFRSINIIQYTMGLKDSGSDSDNDVHILSGIDDKKLVEYKINKEIIISYINPVEKLVKEENYINNLSNYIDTTEKYLLKTNPILRNECYIISMDDKEYKKAVENIRNSGINKINKFDAVYGGLITKKTYDIILSMKAKYLLKNKKWNTASIGCYLSHLELWKKIIDENLEGLYIFEADAICKGEVISKTEEFLKQKEPDLLLIGWLYLHDISDNIKRIGHSINGDNIFKKNNGFIGTQAYYVTFNGAKKLIKYGFQIEQNIDQYISNVIHLGIINAYSTTTNICIQEQEQIL